jgi:hypothetical protein
MSMMLQPGEVLEFRKFIVRLERYEHVPPTSSQRSLQVLLDRYAAAVRCVALRCVALRCNLSPWF